jgi:hypothetical protein
VALQAPHVPIRHEYFAFEVAVLLTFAWARLPVKEMIDAMLISSGKIFLMLSPNAEKTLQRRGRNFQQKNFEIYRSRQWH